MRIALAFAGFCAAAAAVAAGPATHSGPKARPRGLSLEEIRGVMRAHASAFDACLRAATRQNRELHGPFLYDIEVDAHGKVTAARPFQPSVVASFDRCVVGVLTRARFPGGPANVETPLVFDPS